MDIYFVNYSSMYMDNFLIYLWLSIFELYPVLFMRFVLFNRLWLIRLLLIVIFIYLLNAFLRNYLFRRFNSPSCTSTFIYVLDNFRYSNFMRKKWNKIWKKENRLANIFRTSYPFRFSIKSLDKWKKMTVNWTFKTGLIFGIMRRYMNHH